MLKNLNIEDLKYLPKIGVYPCDKIPTPKGLIKIRHKYKMRIKKATSTLACFSPDLCIYGTKLFDQEFEFCSYIGLSGQDIYNICEQLYLNST
jgi:hypothetical protein